MKSDDERPARPRLAGARATGPQGGELAGMDVGMRVLSYLIAGVLCYGGLGWLGDHVLGTGFLLPAGIVLGAAAGCYTIIRRYGQVPEANLLPGRPGASTRHHDRTARRAVRDDTTEGAR